MSRRGRKRNDAGLMHEESSRIADSKLLLDTSDPEDDMHAHLDDQINKITMIADSMKEISPSTMQTVADVDTNTTRTRSLRSRTRSGQHGGQTEMSFNKKSKSSLSVNKNPRLSPLAARAALAAAVLMKPLPQVKRPSLLASETVQSQSSHNTPDSRPATLPAKRETRKRETRKSQKDPKAQEIPRIKTRGYRT